MISTSKTGITSVTYEQLEQVLKSLGFEKNEAPDFIAFIDPESDALIALPPATPDARLKDHHLIAIRTTLEGFGIATESEFYRMLDRPTGITRRNFVLRRPTHERCKHRADRLKRSES